MFILIPIGHERTQVRRPPVVCLSILTLNVVAFLLTYVREGPTVERDVDKPVGLAIRYIEEHPYLDVPAEFEEQLISQQDRAELHRQLEQLLASRPRLPGAEVRRAEQDELERLCRVALQGLTANYVWRFGYIPAHARWWTLLTSMFLHGGWLHLIFNMLFFFLSGPFLEDVYGRVAFSLFYLLSGVTATLVHAAHSPGSTAPLVGASGAIAGLMGAFLVRFFRVKIRFFYVILVFYLFFFLRFAGSWRRLTGTFWAPAYVMLPLWLLQQVFNASFAGESAGVAFWAHIGGFVFGAIVAVGIRMGALEERFVNPGIERSLGIARPAGLVQGMEARAAGRNRQARFYLQQAVSQAPDDPQARFELFQVALALDDEAGIAQHGMKHVAIESRADRWESALATYRQTSERMPALHWPAATLLALGRQAERSLENAEALALYERVAALHPHDPLAARALALAAGIHHRHGDLRLAVDALSRALHVPRIDADLARQLEARMREIAATAGIPVPAVPQVQPKGLPPPVAPPTGRRPRPPAT